MKIPYVEKDFRPSSLRVITTANRIIEEYMAQGYVLTLRQLYYQFVARDLMANKQSEYKRLGKLMGDARLAGLVDWDALEDRTRSLSEAETWTGPDHLIQSARGWYREDLWRDQDYRVEVWVEKEALAGVFARVCNELRVPLFSCRGYASLSSMHEAAMRLRGFQDGKAVVILHFGDHDPSGLDMTRDIEDRLTTFWADVEVQRLALTLDQIREYDPPPNPAKVSDPRAGDYILQYGSVSWELDALEPAVLSQLVRDAVDELRDQERWDAAVESEEESDQGLGLVAKNFWLVTNWLESKP
jgi:hypothetical protein